jgi:hypothetical protein
MIANVATSQNWINNNNNNIFKKKNCSRPIKGIYKIILIFFEGFFLYCGISVFLGIFVCSQSGNDHHKKDFGKVAIMPRKI